MAKLIKELALLGTYGVPMQADTGESSGAPVESTKADTETERVKIAEHGYLGADGTTAVDDEESAHGITYKIVWDKAAKVAVDLPAFTYQYGASPDMDRMLAIFGAKTLSTNESSAARNGKEPSDAAGQLQAVRDRFALLAANPAQWVDRTREGGSRIDLDALAAAYVEVAAAKGATKDLADVRAKLEADKNLRTTVRNIPEVAAAYIARAGRPGKTLDEALALL